MICVCFHVLQRNLARYFKLATLVSLTAGSISAAEPSKSEALLNRVRAAYASGNREQALLLATQAIETDPTDPRAYFVRARIHADAHESAKAVADYDQILKLDPKIANAWQQRGVENFKLAHITQALADFDKFIALAPDQAPHHWQRGIACYYAGQYEDGRKQFELHQTVNPSDVENAVWHFLCVARSASLEQARAALIPIKTDPRPPMMEIYALFAGKAKPEDVLKAASAAEGKRAMFYAHLYLGLYAEATGDKGQAHEHIAKAAGEYQTEDYMGDVARVHLLVRERGEKAPSRDGKAHLLPRPDRYDAYLRESDLTSPLSQRASQG